MSVVGLLLVGLMAGLLSGLMGIGGGVVMVPGLLWVAGCTQKMAQGTSLAVLMMPVSVLAVYTYWKAGHIDWQLVLWVALGFACGSFLGAQAVVSAPEVWLKRLFGVFLLIMGIRLIWQTRGYS